MGKEKSTEQEQKEKHEKHDSLKNAGIVGAAYEVIQRYGSANKEHIVSYSGIDNESGKVLSKSLKSISNKKIHPDYVKQNIKQQAGFSAEVKEVARYNAETIITGGNTYNERWYLEGTGSILSFRPHDDTIRKVRTEDMGMGDHPLFDHVLVDENGKIVSYSGSQMKFTGKTPEEALERLVSKKFQKYLDADISIEVPSDFYDDIRKLAYKKVKSLLKEIKELEKLGKTDIAKQKTKELEKYITIFKNLQKSTVSNADAIEARLDPKLSTAKDIVKISHSAGMKQAGYGAIIGGSTSIIRNFVAVVKGDKEAEDAVVEVIKDTGSSAAVSYATAFSGSAIKGAMQNAKSEVVRSLSKTNLPAMFVTLTIETGKTLSKFIKGEIDGVQCLEELGEKGTSMAASALFTVIGQIAIPIPVIGGMIGGMIGYALSSACYSNLTSALKNAKLARERRIQIEKECEEAIKMIKQYRAEMEIAISEYLSDHIITFNNAFNEIETSLKNGDIDRFINGANTITSKLGGKPQFNNVSEFDELMKNSDNKLIL